MRKLICLAVLTYAMSSLAQTNTYQTSGTTCALNNDTQQLECQAIAVMPSGMLDVTISSYDIKKGTFTNGLAVWTLASDGTDEVTCSGLNGGWDYPQNRENDLRYPTIVTGFCSGTDNNGKNYSLSLVDFLTVYHDNSTNTWMAKIRNGTLTITY